MVAGLLCVVLAVRQNIWTWGAGLVQVSLYIVIFYRVRLYSDVILHVIYFGVQIYGWYNWLHGGRGRRALRVGTLSRRANAGWLAVTLAASALWGWGMASLTDAALPYGDAFTTVASLAAQWLIAQKRLETWYYWIAVDVVAIGIYWVKDLMLTSGLYAVFLVLCLFGLRAWRRDLDPRAAPVEAR